MVRDNVNSFEEQILFAEARIIASLNVEAKWKGIREKTTFYLKDTGIGMQMRKNDLKQTTLQIPDDEENTKLRLN